VRRLRRWVNPNALRLQLNRWLRPFDIGLYRPSLVEAEQGVTACAPLPDGAADVLRADHPRLADLARRYRGHPAAARSGWSDLRLQNQIDLRYFRGDSQYLYQRRGTPEAAYALAADYVARHGALGLLDTLEEDGAFGAVTFELDGRRVSRDLLDSALEIEALAAWLGADRLAAARVLDVGAGYGRLAHRLCSWAPNARVVATDAVPLSTFVCDYYLGYRGVTNAQVVPLDEAESAIARGGFDLAVNIHSFGEAPRPAIAWWIGQIAAAGVPRLWIVHVERELFALENDLSRRSYDDVLAEFGYRRVDLRAKYVRSNTVQRLGAFPAWYHAFERA
jgi:putative sugar O-methyltransferase